MSRESTPTTTKQKGCGAGGCLLDCPWEAVKDEASRAVGVLDTVANDPDDQFVAHQPAR